MISKIRGYIIFSSEMRLFEELKSYEDFKIYFLLFGYIPEPYTTNQGVYALERGTFIRIDLTNFSAKYVKYREILKERNEDTTLNEAIENTRILFKKVILLSGRV